ncbi:hypothetical protein BGZ88_010636, partial [Linnemannia elongata]
VVKAHLTLQERPTYLHPVDENGNLPWKVNTTLTQEPSPVQSRQAKKSKAAPTPESNQGPSRPFKKSRTTGKDRKL